MAGVIEVGVYGGLVQWVRGIPKELEVRVHDYDVDGVDSGIISSDRDGSSCVVVTYKSSNECPDILENI